jgi:hypothetical protein
MLYNGTDPIDIILPDRSGDMSITMIPNNEVDNIPSITRRKVLVYGYYYEDNLGDDMFISAFKLLLPQFELSFTKKLNTSILDKYHAVVVGGGDIFNDYFMDQVREAKHKYPHIPFYAIGCGVSYPSYISTGCTALFEMIYLRNSTDLPCFRMIMGYEYVKAMPDLGFMLQCKPDTRMRKTLVCPATPMMQIPDYLPRLKSAIHEALQLGPVVLVRFNTCGRHNEDDDTICKILMETMPLSYDKTVYNPEQMLKLMSKHDLIIASRFHAHVFGIISGTPLLSVSTTRKTDLLLKEHCPAKLCETLTYYPGSVAKILKNPDVANQLKDIAGHCRSALSKLNLDQIISDRVRRIKKDTEDTTALYQKCRRYVINLTGQDPDDKNIKVIGVSAPEAKSIAGFVCKILTGKEDSPYFWGLMTNIQTKPWELRDMILWICQDMHDKAL